MVKLLAGFDLPTAADDSFAQRKSGVFVPRTIAQVKTDLAIDKVSNVKNNFAGSGAPTTSNNTTQGYSAGSVWLDLGTLNVYVCSAATSSTAGWIQLDTTVNSLGAVGPITFTQTGNGHWGYDYVMGINAATTGSAGSLSAADKTKLDNATSANIASTIMMRDSGGNVAMANAVTAAFNGVSVAQFTDTNGWIGHVMMDGRRVWRKRTIGVATAANTALNTYNGALPTGIANQSLVDILLQVRMANFSSILSAGIDGTEASTTLSVWVSTTDGSFTNAHNSTVDVFMRLEER